MPTISSTPSCSAASAVNSPGPHPRSTARLIGPGSIRPAGRGTVGRVRRQIGGTAPGSSQLMTCIVLVLNGTVSNCAGRRPSSAMEYGLTTRPGSTGRSPDQMEGVRHGDQRPEPRPSAWARTHDGRSSMSTPFAPVQRRTISSEIRAQLLEAIRTGELQPGSPVPAERQLCEQFGVARTSVREAIQGLTASGYLERRGNRPVVAERMPEIRLTGDSATLDERKALVRQLFEVRRTIEPTMSELAARRATSEERADIAEVAARSSDRARRVPHDRSSVPHRDLTRLRQPAAAGGLRQDPRRVVRLRRTRLTAVRRDQPPRSRRHHRLVDRRTSRDRRSTRRWTAQGDDHARCKPISTTSSDA